MFIKCIVLGLAFVASAWADSGHLNSTPDGINESKCNSTQTAKIEAISANMTMCFNSLILHNHTGIKCAKMEDWTAYKQPISDALLCSQINRTELEKGFEMISAMVKFMFEESKSPNFTNLLNRTKKCVNSTKTQIRDCIKKELGVENVSYSSDFSWLMVSLNSANVESACDDARRIKSCVLERLNNSAHCLPETKRITNSLFDVAEKMEQCNNANTSGPSTVIAAKLSTTSVVFIVLGLLLVMIAIIAVVCCKGKCRRN